VADALWMQCVDVLNDYIFRTDRRTDTHCEQKIPKIHHNFFFFFPFLFCFSSSHFVNRFFMSLFKGKERSIFLFAVVYRVLVWTTSSIFDAWINDYDTSSDIALHPFQGASNTVLTCPRFIRVFAKWDAVFFGQIAEHGYEFEKFHAFFPLLPFLMNIGRHLCMPSYHPSTHSTTQPLNHKHACLLCIGFLMCEHRCA
jgi:hypothetical protein